MDRETLTALLTDLASGVISADEAYARLAQLPFADLGDVKLDHHRSLRQGLPEAIYGPGKTPDQCVRIVRELTDNGSGPIVITRTDEYQRAELLQTFPDAIVADATLVWRAAQPRTEHIAIVTAGTSDLPVANECGAILHAYGFKPTSYADCGVAGVHRLLASLDDLQNADAVVVVAGMEGALPSLVGGLLSAPIVAVPTSTGYGSSFEGITALLAMLSSCAPGITVVGIDNGYGAACAIARMLSRAS